MDLAESERRRWITAQMRHIFAKLPVPLGAFDVILGMDWLETHNPNIDWVGKSLTMGTPQGQITLHGNRSEVTQCSAISATEWQQSVDRDL